MTLTLGFRLKIDNLQEQKENLRHSKITRGSLNHRFAGDFRYLKLHTKNGKNTVV